MTATTCATRAEDVPETLGPARVVYVFEGLGRLRAVTDVESTPPSTATTLSATSWGIDRHRSDVLSVIELGRVHAAAGDEVTVWGTSYDAAATPTGTR